MPRQFADLSSYRRLVDAQKANPNNILDSAIQGFTQGNQLANLPDTLQQQALTKQLQNALLAQKIQDLQNPDAALARELQKIAIKESVTNPNSGIIQSPVPGTAVSTPGAIGQTATGLEAALQANPSMEIPSVAPGLPITPIGTGSVQTGLSIDPNIPLEADARSLDAKIKLLQARPFAQQITKEGYRFNPGNGQLEQVILPTDPNLGLEDRRKLEAEAAAKAKTDAATELLDKKQTFTGDQKDKDRALRSDTTDKNIEARKTLADKRAKLSEGVASTYQSERQQRVLDSVNDLEKDVGYDTVGFADWFKAVPSTPAKNFSARLKTLKGAIAFNELAQMREASKTGGALGAVSNVEIGLLESSLGALDQAQSPSEFKEELGKIRESIQRWQQAASGSSQIQSPSSGFKINSIRLKAK